MLYTIEILPSTLDSRYDIVTTNHNLIHLLLTLEDSVKVSQYKVSTGADTNLQPTHFGWSNSDFKKWVKKFTYPKY